MKKHILYSDLHELLGARLEVQSGNSGPGVSTVRPGEPAGRPQPADFRTRLGREATRKAPRIRFEVVEQAALLPLPQTHSAKVRSR